MAKNILITGCSTGIGLCLAKGLRKQGYHVFATARQAQDVEKLKTQGFDAYLLDLENSASIQTAVKQIFEKSNAQIYALIHNGAYGLAGALSDVSRTALRAQFETNVFGWHELTNLLLPVMRKQNLGRIIYISSVLGFVAMPFRGAYNASKFATEGLADTLRLELSNTNIKISTVQPGPIHSEFRKNAYQAFKRFISVEGSAYQSDYNAMIKRLQSDKDAPYTLAPEAVLSSVLHALSNKKPQTHYHVTLPTKLFAFLIRICSRRFLDKILRRAGGMQKTNND